MHSKNSGQRARRNFSFPVFLLVCTQKHSVPLLRHFYPPRDHHHNTWARDPKEQWHTKGARAELSHETMTCWRCRSERLRADPAESKAQTLQGPGHTQGQELCRAHTLLYCTDLAQMTLQTLLKNPLSFLTSEQPRRRQMPHSPTSLKKLSVITFNTSDKDNMIMLLTVDYSCSRSFI